MEGVTNVTSMCPLRQAQCRGVFFSVLEALTSCLTDSTVMDFFSNIITSQVSRIGCIFARLCKVVNCVCGSVVYPNNKIEKDKES